MQLDRLYSSRNVASGIAVRYANGTMRYYRDCDREKVKRNVLVLFGWSCRAGMMGCSAGQVKALVTFT